MERKKIRIEFDCQGESGNIFHIIGQVNQAMRKEHRIMEFNEIRDEVFASQSYSEALAHIRKHIDLIDIRGNI